MKNLHRYIAPFIIACFLITLGGCEKSGELKLRAESLLQRAEQLDNEYAQINSSIDSLWDTTSAQLESSLPSDIPPMDRDIFLKSRNADHIRMFMSFKNLSPQLQSLVNEAGCHDQMLASRMRDLALDRQEFEKQKMQLLLDLERENAGTSKYYAEQFRNRNTQAEQ